MAKDSILEKFSIDLTKMAENGELDPVIGREDEIKRISTILSRRRKNNPILIGEPGVGKTAIAEGLATKIINKKVPRTLCNKRILSLDLSSLVAGTKYRGQFEERMKIIIDEIEKDKSIIIFVDEIHTIVGAGNSSGSLDASNMLKPALARGTIQCIGATTLDEYRKSIEKDGALERRFQKVIVDQPTIEETLEIINQLKVKYEDYHLVNYTPEAIKSCVKLSERYLTDRFFPDKAIDVMDEAGSKVHINNINVPKEILDIEKEIDKINIQKNKHIEKQEFEEAANMRDNERKLKEKLQYVKEEWENGNDINRLDVTEDDISEAISTITGIPINKISQNEGSKLLNIHNELSDQVIGQKEAIMNISKAIRRNRAGLKNPNRPIGSFIFLGPTGVGKTYLAKVLTKYMFDSEDSMIRIDMSEYMEKHSVSRLIGSPPGYVGYDEGGQLTEKIRRKPYSIVLFDEIEKAHPDVINILLQVLDDGILTDNYGRKVDFKNTIIIMTSNIGTRQVKDFGSGIGFKSELDTKNKGKTQKSLVEKSLKKYFSPEFLNRLDDVVVFNSLEKTDIKKIIDLELKDVFKRIEDIKITITDNFKDFLVEKGYDPHYGARPLKRAIQKYIEDPVSEELLKSNNIYNIKLDYDKKIDDIKVRVTLNPSDEPIKIEEEVEEV
jgi:ATP-dependent Clp protease ATP-binding subunit ClpC